MQAVGDVARRSFFTAHRLVQQLDAGAGWPQDLEQSVRHPPPPTPDDP